MRQRLEFALHRPQFVKNAQASPKPFSPPAPGHPAAGSRSSSPSSAARNRVERIHPAQHLHQRRFAGAFAHSAVFSVGVISQLHFQKESRSESFPRARELHIAPFYRTKILGDASRAGRDQGCFERVNDKQPKAMRDGRPRLRAYSRLAILPRIPMRFGRQPRHHLVKRIFPSRQRNAESFAQQRIRQDGIARPPRRCGIFTRCNGIHRWPPTLKQGAGRANIARANPHQVV